MTQTETPGGPKGPGDTPGGRALSAPELDQKEKALARVALWWPKGLERTDPEPPAVAFTRQAVTTWGPPNPAEASQALATSYRYCIWRLDRGVDLEPQTAFNLDDVVAYIDGPLVYSPKSTRKSARTYLRRLDPGPPARRGEADDRSRYRRQSCHLPDPW